MSKSTATSVSPSTRMLGIELKDWRQRRRRSGDQAAVTCRVSPSLISRMERGHRPPSDDLLRLLLNLYQVPEPERGRLRSLRAAAAAEHLAGERADQDLVTEMLAWAPITVPAPLTTELYARAVTQSLRRVRRYTPTEIKQLARAGVEWQSRLTGPEDGDDPQLEVRCILDEAVLRRRCGPTSAMAGQLDLLTRLAALPSVDLRVRTFDLDGPATGPFSLYGYGNDDLTDVVMVEGPAGTERIMDERTVTDYRLAFEEMLAAVPDRETSAVMIKQAAESWA